MIPQHQPKTVERCLSANVVTMEVWFLPWENVSGGCVKNTQSVVFDCVLEP